MKTVEGARVLPGMTTPIGAPKTSLKPAPAPKTAPKPAADPKPVAAPKPLKLHARDTFERGGTNDDSV